MHPATVGTLGQAAEKSAFRKRVLPANRGNEFSKTEVEKSIAARFEKQVKLHGTRPAVATADYQLTYDALNGRANQIARAIQNISSSSARAVALLLEHDAPLIAAILGVLKAGRFYVALEPSHPSERLRNILEDSQADLLIADTKHAGQAQEIGSPKCAFLNLDTLEADLSDENLDLETSPSTLAYLIYTSGSTGKPKGVCQTQRNVLHHTRKYTNACHLCADDRFSLLALCSFGASVSNLFGALLNGGALLPFDVKEEGIASLRAWLQKEQISIYHSVPLLFRKLAQSLSDDSSFPDLRLIKLGGEAVTRDDFDLYKKHFSDRALLYVGLGASEMNSIRYWLLDGRSSFRGPTVPVGFAVEDTDVILLDEHQKEVAAGEVGEIAVRSQYLFPGYWRRPELTNAVLVKDPRGSAIPVFRTGDLGRFLDGEMLLHLGRNENQIKIRGARIDPAEVEYHLRQQPEIDQCVVMAATAADQPLLVAYLTSNGADKPESATLRQRLAEVLPRFMLPSKFVWLDEWPLLNGKIDRRALKAVDLESTSNYTAPQSTCECQLVEIWQRALGQDRIGVRDSFAELGGDSLSAVQVVLQIEEIFHCRLPVAILFQLPTIESLARYITQEGFVKPLPSLIPLQAAGSKPPLYIVHGWGGDVYFFHELAKLLPDQPVFGIQAAGLDGKTQRHIRIEDMATHYIAEIRAFQPTGPYNLVGYSLGSLVAFEVAQQLAEAGEHISFLGLLDPPHRPAPWLAYLRTLFPYFCSQAQYYHSRWRRSGGKRSMHLRRRIKAFKRWLQRNRARAPVLRNPPAKSVAPPEVSGFRDYYSAVAFPYRLRKYPGAIDVIAGDSPNPILLPLWGHLAKGGARLHQISCTHKQMIARDFLPTLATTLRTALANARSRSTKTRSKPPASA